jgi:hypothetical protein
LATSEEVLLGVLTDTAAEGEFDLPWAEVHTPRIIHPLSADFREASRNLDLECNPIGGDFETV